MHRHRRDKARPQGGLTEEQKQEIRCAAGPVQCASPRAVAPQEVPGGRKT